MGAGYENLNARAKAIKGRLLMRELLLGLTSSEDLEGFSDRLAASTPYGRELPPILETKTELSQVEAALIAHLVHLSQDFVRAANERARRWLSLWLAPWDLTNLVRILRGWRFHSPPEEILSGLSPAGAFSSGDLETLLSSGTPSELAARLLQHGGLWREIAAALRDHEADPLKTLEDALYRAWAGYAAGQCATDRRDGPLFSPFFAWEIDGRNFVNALRMARDGEVEERAFLPGGARLSLERFREIAGAEGLGEALSIAEGTVFGEAVTAEEPPFEARRALSRVERRVRKKVLLECQKEYRRSDPLGVGVLLWVFQLKANEVRNLRSIAAGLEHRLPAAVIGEEIVLV
ncbi:MAG TPA: V-type ATPase subunit [Vicinamibacteria bacterium]